MSQSDVSKADLARKLNYWSTETADAKINKQHTEQRRKVATVKPVLNGTWIYWNLSFAENLYSSEDQKFKYFGNPPATVVPL